MPEEVELAEQDWDTLSQEDYQMMEADPAQPIPQHVLLPLETQVVMPDTRQTSRDMRFADAQVQRPIEMGQQ